MQFLIQAEWVQQEAEERDVKVTDAEVKKSFEDQKKQAFPKEADYQKFLKTSGHDRGGHPLPRQARPAPDQAHARRSPKDKVKITDEDIEDYYDKNKKRFAQPERARPERRAHQDQGEGRRRPRASSRAARASRPSPRSTRSTRPPRPRAASCRTSPRASRRRRSTRPCSRPRRASSQARSRPSSATTCSRSRRSSRPPSSRSRRPRRRSATCCAPSASRRRSTRSSRTSARSTRTKTNCAKRLPRGRVQERAEGRSTDTGPASGGAPGGALQGAPQGAPGTPGRRPQGTAAGPAAGRAPQGAAAGPQGAAPTPQTPAADVAMARSRRPPRTRAPGRDHPAAAAGVPVGPRAGRALDRPRTRSRRPTSWPTPRTPGDDAKLLDELGDVLFQVYFLSLLLEERGRGRPGGGGRQLPREADPPPPARVRRRGGARRRRGRCATGTQIKSRDRARRAVFGDLPETLPSTLLAKKVQRRAARARRPARRRVAARGRATGREAHERFEAAGELLFDAVAVARSRRRPGAGAAGAAADRYVANRRREASERDRARARPADPRQPRQSHRGGRRDAAPPARVGRAAVPSGASTGEFEAVELRDGGEAWGGKGVTQGRGQRERRAGRGRDGPRRRRPGRRSTAR